MKTITLDEEAYEALAALKVDSRDSFSRVVKRHFRTSGLIRPSSGTWADVTDEEVATMRRETVDAFETRRRGR